MDLAKQVASKLVVDPTAPTWVFENEPSVMRGDGQADYVVSAFRQSPMSQVLAMLNCLPLFCCRFVQYFIIEFPPGTLVLLMLSSRRC